jgi:RNA polymerase sigma-70 factor (ECF subfamily)
MTTDAVDIQRLLDRLRSGDQQALGELFARFRPQLRRMVELRIDPRLAARVGASDVLQEAYVDALKRQQHFFERENVSFYVWLRLVVNQSLVDTHRRHLGAKMRDAGQEQSIPPTAGGGSHWAAATSISLARHLVAQVQSPSQVLRQEETLQQVQAALESLEPLDREVLTLRHFEELSNNEVAELLGLQKAAASNRYVRALGRLREALGKVPGFFEDAE